MSATAGRKRTVNLNLPPRMRARSRGKKVHYYYDTGGRPRHEIPLGSDYTLAVRAWSELHMAKPSPNAVTTFRMAAERYIKEVLPGKAPRTQAGNIEELNQLYKFFDNPPAPLDSIQPLHIRQYMDLRGKEAKIRANREKALFSHIFNKARSWGYTDKANPCAGIKGFPEKGRKDVYIEDDTYKAVYAVASQPLKDAMDLAYLTAQRPADVLKMAETDICDGALRVRQDKTSAKLRISIEGELASLIDRIRTRKSKFKVCTLALIVNDHGEKFTTNMLRTAFDAARAAAGVDKASFHFRDLRAKAATDKTESSGDIRQAQGQLGHTTIGMTEKYVRDRKGKKVTPTK